VTRLRALLPLLLAVTPVATAPSPSVATPATPPEDVVAQLLLAVRSEDALARATARAELARLHVVPDYDRYDAEGDVDLGPESAEVLMVASELRGTDLVGSFRIHVGAGLLPRPGVKLPEAFPTGVRYRLTISGDGIEDPVVHEEELGAGETERRDVLLATRLSKGTFEVALTLHATYVDAAGQYRILDESVPVLVVAARPAPRPSPAAGGGATPRAGGS
jgi:hypothetical protein